MGGWRSQKMVCPKEVVWLNGAPGSGKGANTPFILESRGLSRAVSMSSLLEHNLSIKALMEAGELVPDAMVPPRPPSFPPPPPPPSLLLPPAAIVACLSPAFPVVALSQGL